MKFLKLKVARLLAEFPDRNRYRPVAYGNSRAGKQLLEFADENIFV
ncbi:MAG: hypothetical protein LBD80_03850 [Tannerella sp.]|jgi:hypothetical protein|nr:hypothetical protein [Tannerella sp.]